MWQQFPTVVDVFEQGRARGLHHGLQLWVAHRGQVQIDAALGDASPGVPLTADHWLQWLSSGKPLTAVLIAQLKERGELEWDDAVTRFLPEFAANGKGGITVRHLLTHTAGLRQIETGWPECEWDATIERICQAAPDPDAVPGQTAGYHVASTWFVLGEIARRCRQQPFVDIIRESLLEPCGMSETSFALTASEQQTLGDRNAPLWERTKFGLERLDWHEPPRVTRPSPGSSARGPVRELGRFYETLRQASLGNAAQILQPETMAELTTRQRIGEFDQTLGHVIDFGLGVIIDSNRYGTDSVPYGYGRACSEQTYGHGGAQSSQGYCDPVHELTVAYVFNGRAGEAQHSRRCRSLNDAIYRDLGVG